MSKPYATPALLVSGGVIRETSSGGPGGSEIAQPQLKRDPVGNLSS
jgi:hypothetical protein